MAHHGRGGFLRRLLGGEHHNEHGRSMQYDEHGRPMQYDEHGRPLQYDEHGRPFRYDEHEYRGEHHEERRHH